MDNQKFSLGNVLHQQQKTETTLEDFSKIWPAWHCVSQSPSDLIPTQIGTSVAPKRRAKRSAKSVPSYSSSSSTSATTIRPKRKKSSDKERQRNLEIKCHLQTLTTLLPGVKTDLPRIRTLRLAKEYITHLGRILHGEQIFCEQTRTWRPLSVKDFEREVHKEMQITNSYKQRAQLELSSQMSSENSSPSAQTSSSQYCSPLS